VRDRASSEGAKQWKSLATRLAADGQAMMELSQRYPFVLAANLHGGEVVVAYPYDNHNPGYRPARAESGVHVPT
jgi:hypothetical protein